MTGKGSEIFHELTDRLLNSNEPSVRYKIRVNVMRENRNSASIKSLQREIKNSATVKKLFLNRDAKGRIVSARNVYDKWQGAHWILASLADIGYPPGDKTLFPVRDEVLKFWLDDYYFHEYVPKGKSDVYSRKYFGVPLMEGRYRRCASQQGYALFYLIRLGLDDERIHELSERLLHWQWADGGWNCDKNPSASKSSFIHTTWTLRGLGLYAEKYKNEKVKDSVKRAAEVLLSRKLFKRIKDNSIIKPEFIYLHYPLYWHYDILGGLKVMAETGFIKDKRCREALDLLQSKMLKGGGWRAERKYYKTSDELKHGNDYVDWGGTNSKVMNEWITADALYVLKKAGRIKF